MISMTEHPGWHPHGSGHARLASSGEGLWLATAGTDGINLACVDGPDDAKPELMTSDPDDLPAALPPQLATALTRLGPVQRMANPWLWDALSTAILRQVVRAAQARTLYQAWCANLGTVLTTPAGDLAVAPGPAAVLLLEDDAFAENGTRFHRDALRAAATACLEHAEHWASLAPADLAHALQTIPRIGPWTARAAAADYTGDFSIYPHGDLAVRTWATAAAPDLEWPQKERPFEAAWTGQTKTTNELHTLTQLTLAWGSHEQLRHQDDRA